MAITNILVSVGANYALLYARHAIMVDFLNKICKKWNINVLFCILEETRCTSCKSGTYLYSNTCLSSCPVNFWGNSSTQTCDSCDSSCYTCTDPGK